MEVELVDNRTVATYARRTVKSVRRLNSVYTEVSFTEPLPDGVAPKHVVAADGEYPDVEIRGCRMRGNRARGLLLGSRGRIVVEDNYFHIAGAAILFEGDANYWFEQSGVRDVVIRGNLFENGNYGCPSWGRGLHRGRERYSGPDRCTLPPQYPRRGQYVPRFRPAHCPYLFGRWVPLHARQRHRAYGRISLCAGGCEGLCRRSVRPGGDRVPRIRGGATRKK